MILALRILMSIRGRSRVSVFTFSMSWTTSVPLYTLPNTVCLPSSLHYSFLPRSRGSCDEKLRAVCIRKRSVSHTDDVGLVMLQRWMKFVLELTSPDRFSYRNTGIPPVPSPFGQPVWIMKPLMILWKMRLL